MTPTCDRRQSTDLAHAATCPSCGDALRALGRIEHALASIHDDRRPPPGWKTRLLAAIPTTARPVRKWTWRRLALAIVPLGAIAGLAILVASQSPNRTVPLEQELILDVAVNDRRGLRSSPSGPRHRSMRGASNARRFEISNEAGLLTAHGAGGPPLRTLTLYWGTTRFRSCPSDDGCAVRAGMVTLRAPTVLGGRYTILYVAGDVAFVPRGTLDADLAAALASGAKIAVKTVDVQ